MPAEPGHSFAIHATAVVIDGRALLIRGASCAGKSRLAIALIARATQDLPIRLLGDDRILLARGTAGLVARPHPRIAGFIERRGLGLVAMPWIAQATVGGLVEIGSVPEPMPWSGERDGWDMPMLALDCAGESARADHVLAWWAGLTAARAPHPSEKAAGLPLADAKD